MSRKLHSIFTIVAVALLALGTSGCVEPLDDSSRPVVDTNSRDLTIRLYMPGAMPATKAGTGDVKSVSPESALYNIQVWMFDHVTAGASSADNQKAIAYSEITDIWTNTSNLPSGSGYYTDDPYWGRIYTYEVKLSIPGYFLDRDASQMKVDFYVLANGPSIGNPANRDMTRKQLRDMQFGGSYFGTATPATEVPETGLPISGFFNKTNRSGSPADGVDISFLKTTQEITPTLIHQNMPIVQLERAVAKIRFAFVRPTGMSGVQVTKIVIDKQLIPSQTYVFPRETGDFLGTGTNDYPADYYSEANAPAATISGVSGAPLLADSAIKEAEDPESLKSTSETTFSATGKSYDGKTPATMSAQAYSDLLDDYATSQNVYLRESSEMITGKIYYKLSESDTEQSASFTMTPDGSSDTYTNFHRNHSWIVYAYFQGEGLYIKPVVLPWQDGTSYTYTQRGSAVVAISDGKESIFGYGWTTSNDNTWWTDLKVTAVETQYYASNTDKLPDNPVWKSAWAAGDFTSNSHFWTRSKVTLSDGRVVYSNPVAATDVTSMTVEYASGTSGSVAPTTGWSTTPPDPIWQNNHVYLWSRTTVVDSNSESSVSYECLAKLTEWYFRRQDEAYTSNWAHDWIHSQVVSAPGLNAGGVPVYANRIELRTSGFNVPLRLKLSSTDDFYVVTYNSSNAEYVSWISGSALAPTGWTEADGALIPQEVSAGGTTYFYVVPKDDASHEGKTVELYLVTDPTDGSGSQKIPFNAGVFPGSEDNTDIHFYSVSSDTFKSYYTSSRPANVKPYDQSGEEVTI